MIAAMLLSLQLYSPIYEVRFVAFDQRGFPLYQRPAWIFLGNPEPLGDRPLPEGFIVQDVDISIRVTTVPNESVCVVAQEAITEVGRQMYFGCQP